MALIGGDPSGEPAEHHVTRLQEAVGGPERLPVVGA
jgi:hypothetical protein